jgi:C-terminal processing protease CtpA/Prc
MKIRNFRLPHVQLKLPRKALMVLLVVGIFGVGILTGYSIYSFHPVSENSATVTPEDKYLLFTSEIYDKIMQNYFDAISEEELAKMYRQVVERLVATPQKLELNPPSESGKTEAQSQTNPVTGFAPSLNLQGSSVQDLKILTNKNSQNRNSYRKSVENLIQKNLGNLSKDKQKDFVVQVSGGVLSSLSPVGRSGLYTQKQEKQLQNTVQNINPEKDLYADLGLNKGSTTDEVEKAYQEKAEDLSKDQSPNAQAELKKLSYAKEVLTDQDKKQNYDAKGVEPTVSKQIVSPDIAFVKFDKFSPTTYEEFVKTITSFDRSDGPTALIFDLRSNIGGAIDALPYLLGNFLGDKQYVYDFLKKGEYETYRSIGQKLPGLIRMKQVVILVDGNTQSSAELMAASLKRYHYGLVVGVPTKGWGTVERVFSLDNQIDENEKYSMFLVHSITLRDDNQPIEGRGVEPDININNSDWDKQLFSYFRNTDLVEAVKNEL